MDYTTLVDAQIADAKKLVEDLTRNGFEVGGAAWLKETRDENWRFYIISPLVESQGIREAYGLLGPLTRKLLPQPLSINPLRIRLVGTEEPLGKAVLAAIKNATSSPIRWFGIRLGDVAIEDAYLYAPPVAAQA